MISPALSRMIETFGTWRKATWIQACHKAIEQQACCLIETGCFRGTLADGASTLILAQLAKDLRGHLDSYELEPKNIAVAQQHLAKHGLANWVTFHQGDSVTNLAGRQDEIDFAYLDSFDCGLGPDYSPCQKHHLAEVDCILPLMARRSAILLDDHIEETGGKTKLAMQRLDRLQWDRLATDYQVLYATENSHRLVPHRFCVLTGHLPNYAAMAARTCYYNKSQYALSHGYDIQFTRTVSSEFNDSRNKYGGFSWARLKHALKLVRSGCYRWVWIVGCDTLVTNMGAELESLTEDSQTYMASRRLPPVPAKHKMAAGPDPHSPFQPPPGYPLIGEKHVIMCGEAVAPLQADSFLVRGTDEGASFLVDILSRYKEYKESPWIDNQTMLDLRLKWAHAIHIVPQHLLNSYDYSMWHHAGAVYKSGKDCYGHRGQWEPGDFLIHWPATSYEERMRRIAEMEKRIIYEDSPALPENHQTRRPEFAGVV